MINNLLYMKYVCKSIIYYIIEMNKEVNYE
nr:MAG TPA: hypothetical protein [Caudoviricetes sp.]